jgi:hypothetical protein
VLPDVTIVSESGLHIVSAIKVNLDGSVVEHTVQGNDTSFSAPPYRGSYLPRTEYYCSAILGAYVLIRDLGRVEHFNPIGQAESSLCQPISTRIVTRMVPLRAPGYTS